MKKYIVALCLLVASSANAVPFVHPGLFADGALGASPDPKQTVAIADDFSHTKSVAQNIWYDLVYAGSTCIVRLMNTNIKASWPKETVISTHSYLIHNNTNFLNYSGCSGGTLHLQ